MGIQHGREKELQCIFYNIFRVKFWRSCIYMLKILIFLRNKSLNFWSSSRYYASLQWMPNFTSSIKVMHVSSSYIVILLFCTATWIWAITELQTCHRRLSYFPGEKNRVCDSLLQLNFIQFKFCLTVGYLFIHISLQIPGGVDLCWNDGSWGCTGLHWERKVNIEIIAYVCTIISRSDNSWISCWF